MNNKLFKFFGSMVLCLNLINFASAQRVTSANLNVTIDDSVSQSYGIQSDGTAVPYRNGANSTQAVFDSNGHFVFNSGTRPVNFIYSFPLDTTAQLSTDTQSGVKARTFPINTAGYVPIQNMAAGTSQCLGLGWELPTGDVAGTKREIGYHYFRGVLTNTAYITVTYNGSTWTLEPANRANCVGNGDTTFDNAARVRDTKTAKGKTTDYDIYGRYFMPFKLTLTKQ